MKNEPPSYRETPPEVPNQTGPLILGNGSYRIATEALFERKILEHMSVVADDPVAVRPEPQVPPRILKNPAHERAYLGVESGSSCAYEPVIAQKHTMRHSIPQALSNSFPSALRQIAKSIEAAGVSSCGHVAGRDPTKVTHTATRRSRRSPASPPASTGPSGMRTLSWPERWYCGVHQAGASRSRSTAPAPCSRVSSPTAR